MTCKHIIFSRADYVPDSVITATPAPITSLENLKNFDQAKQARWNVNCTGDIVIEGTFSSPRGLEYFALPNSNLGVHASAVVKLELFETDTSTTDLLNMEPQEIGGAVPWGIAEFGVDPFAGGIHPPMNNVWALFFDQVIVAQRWKLTLTYTVGTDDETVQVHTTDQNGQLGIPVDSAQVIAENENGVDTWSVAAGNYSSYSRVKTGGFHASALEGPRLVFPFRATQSGTFNFWVLAKKESADSGNSIFTIIDSEQRLSVMNTLNESVFSWQLVRVASLVSGRTYYFEVCGREAGVMIDKFVLRPTSLPDPANISDSALSDVPEGTANISMRMAMTGPILMTQNNISYGSSLTLITDPTAYQTEGGGHVIGDTPQLIRELTANIQRATDDDRFDLSLLETRMRGAPILVNAYPSKERWFSDQYLMLGSVQRLTYTHSEYDRHTIPLKILEA